ncbi:MAG TPA: hypothetical protein VD931_10875, partial [Baekduia sp.]|nr:hypothetical protein [Baekduia sp.]
MSERFFADDVSARPAVRGAGSMLAADLRGAAEQALASGRHAIDRLSHAATSITFRITDAPERSFTLLLDRRPCVVVDPEPAEIELRLRGDQ